MWKSGQDTCHSMRVLLWTTFFYNIHFICPLHRLNFLITLNIYHSLREDKEAYSTQVTRCCCSRHVKRRTDCSNGLRRYTVNAGTTVAFPRMQCLCKAVAQSYWTKKTVLSALNIFLRISFLKTCIFFSLETSDLI